MAKSKEEDRENLEFKEKELVLRTSKEIIIKFIEMGQVTPTNFDQFFDIIYKKIWTLSSKNPSN